MTRLSSTDLRQSMCSACCPPLPSSSGMALPLRLTSNPESSPCRQMHPCQHNDRQTVPASAFVSGKPAHVTLGALLDGCMHNHLLQHAHHLQRDLLKSVTDIGAHSQRWICT